MAGEDYGGRLAERSAASRAKPASAYGWGKAIGRHRTGKHFKLPIKRMPSFETLSRLGLLHRETFRLLGLRLRAQYGPNGFPET